MHAITINENRDGEFKEEQGRVCERVLRKKRERNVIEYNLKKGEKKNYLGTYARGSKPF